MDNSEKTGVGGQADTRLTMFSDVMATGCLRMLDIMEREKYGIKDDSIPEEAQRTSSNYLDISEHQSKL